MSLVPNASETNRDRDGPATKRRLRFWLILAGSIFVGVPLLLFLVAWGYLNFGFLNATLEQRMTTKLGVTPHVGTIRSNPLSNLSIQEISIPPQGPGEPITVASTKLDFNIFDALANGRLRSLTLERPRVDLRYDPATGWNHVIKASTESGTPIEINKFDIRDGNVAVDWTSGRVKLSEVSGDIQSPSDGAKYGARNVQLHGKMESGNAVAVDGIWGPGMAYDGRVRGVAKLKEDVAAWFGLNDLAGGTADCDIKSSHAKSTADAKYAMPFEFDGKLKFENARWNISESPPQSFALNCDETVVKGAWRPGAPNTLAISDWRINGLELNGSMWGVPAPDVNISGVISGSMDFAEGGRGISIRALLDLAERKRKGETSPGSTIAGPRGKAIWNIEAKFARAADSGWTMEALNAPELTIPLAPVGRMLGWPDKAGVTPGGELKGTDIKYDPATGAVTGKLSVKRGAVRCAISNAMRRQAGDILNSINESAWSLALATIREWGVKRVHGEFSFHATRDHVRIQGRTDAIPLFAQALIIDVTEFEFPPAEVVVEVSALPGGAYSIQSEVKWSDGRFTATILAPASGAWNCKGTLAVAGLIEGEANFSGTFDPKTGVGGPVNFLADAINLTALRDMLDPSPDLAIPRSESEIRGIRLRVESFAIDPGKLIAISGRAAFDGLSFGSLAATAQKFDFETRDAGVFVRSPDKPAGTVIATAKQLNDWVGELLKNWSAPKVP